MKTWLISGVDTDDKLIRARTIERAAELYESWLIEQDPKGEPVRAAIHEVSAAEELEEGIVWWPQISHGVFNFRIERDPDRLEMF